MSSIKRGLGRGLDALLATSAKAQSRIEEQESPPSITSPLQQLSITELVAGRYQPRKDMEPSALEELAESIRAQGIIQPIVVRNLDDNRYEIIAGERRFRAAKLAGLSHVPCLVRVMDDQEASAIALIENIQRENLNVMEEAEALARLVDDFSLTHQQLAESLGKSRAAISNLLRLNSLAAPVKEMLFTHQLEMGHARALLPLDKAKQVEVALTAVSKNYTVRQTESLVKKLLSPTKTSGINSDPMSDLQNKLAKKLGANVTLSQKPNGKGKLVISFEQKEKLEQILSILGVSF